MEINKIVQGNCLELMKEIEDNSFEMTLTDIPYAVVNRKSNGLRNLDKKDADEETFSIEEFLPSVVRLTKGSVYVFCSTEQVSEIRGGLVDLGLTTRLCIWKKAAPSPMNGQFLWLSGIECCVYGKKKKAIFNEHCKNPVWEYASERNKLHPTQKPLKLFQYLITVSSNPGDCIFDPCIGSGTTALAAIKEKRNYFGIDLSSEYVETAKNRLLTNSDRL